ncbi:MAG TPA: 3-dehydroquinate synthase [Casimicrobiaceae bacterium]|nr:3-dehydroquinate synthase [Casimicrobiaceae bacterium]
MRTLDVALGERAYPIHVGAGVLDRAGELLSGLATRRAVVVTNATVAAHWLPQLRRALAGGGFAVDVVLVPDGEAHKSMATLQDVLTRLLELGAERSTVLVALGGGVVGDLAGFAAAIYQRGMPFVQVPTTLLAQVDSSVGGKTAVNHPLGKNMIGAFWQPRAVLADTACLRTLPGRELSAGLAEIVKAGAIRDAAFLDWLDGAMARLVARDDDTLTQAILESCRIKAAVVAADERETGERALLNFGHTFGHAIETAAGYGAWLHGEAVAAGMAIAGRLSARVCGLPVQDAQRLEDVLARARLPLVPPAMPLERWLALMARDKKVEAGRMRFVLLEALGCAVVRGGIAEDDLAAVLGAAA